MKTYRVLILDQTIERLESYLDYLEFEQHSPKSAERWARRAVDKLKSLRQLPNRCPYAPENESCEYEVRMMIVDRCLFIFHVHEQSRVVRVLNFRHGSQLPQPEDLPDEI